jgi:AcrR family transcriptional regulator
MHTAQRRRRPRGAVREGLVAAGLELARAGGPDAVVLREATRMVGVVPNAAYRHFADRDELLAAVSLAAMGELADRMAAGVAGVPGPYGDPTAATLRLGAIGTAYLAFARDEPGLFATAFALPQQHTYRPDDGPGPDRSPLGQLQARLAELVDAGVLNPQRRAGIEYPIWDLCVTSRRSPAGTSKSSPSVSSTLRWPEPPGRGPAIGLSPSGQGR